MKRKIKLNKKTLRAFFDYNSFSQNQKLEKIARESLERTSEAADFPEETSALTKNKLNKNESDSSQTESENSSFPLELNSLENLSAAGNINNVDIPSSPKKR